MATTVKSLAGLEDTAVFLSVVDKGFALRIKDQPLTMKIN